MRRRLPFRIAAGGLSLVYFTVNVALAHARESDFWAERRVRARLNAAPLMAGLPGAASASELLRQLPSLDRVSRSPALSPVVAENLPRAFVQRHADLLNALSYSFGTVRRIALPDGGDGARTVVHIQDVHMNAEAQANIGRAVETLTEKGQAGLLALEGAFGPMDFSAYRALSRRDFVQKAADYLLRVNEISGPVHAALTGSAAPPAIVGIDDPAHYRENVEAYRRSVPLTQDRKEKLVALRTDLDRRKAAVFSPELLVFDRKTQSYREGKTSLGDYVSFAAPLAPAGAPAPSVRDFLEALALERSLDFKRVEAERGALVERLVRTLDKERINALVQWSAAYRLGQLRYADFYRSLRDLCRSAGVDLKSYPAMDEYVRYVLSSDRIDAERLMAGVAALEESVYGRLARTEAERRLVERSKRLTLAGKLLDFSLTPEEYREYAAASGDAVLGDLSAFEAFYKEAQARDQSMTDNLLKAMDGKKTGAAVLVTGGYHSPGIDERLRRAGVTVISFVPKIEKLDAAQGSAYLSVFTREKTPLDKLFQGQKLFLAEAPGKGAPKLAVLYPAAGVNEERRKGVVDERKLAEAGENFMTEVRKALSERGLSLPDGFTHGWSVKPGPEGGSVVSASAGVPGGDHRTVEYAVTYSADDALLDVRSTESRSDYGDLLHILEPLAEMAAQDLARGVPAEIAERPLVRRLPFLSAGRKAWFINLHRRQNETLTEIVARAQGLELIGHVIELAQKTAPSRLVDQLVDELAEVLHGKYNLPKAFGFAKLTVDKRKKGKTPSGEKVKASGPERTVSGKWPELPRPALLDGVRPEELEPRVLAADGFYERLWGRVRAGLEEGSFMERDLRVGTVQFYQGRVFEEIETRERVIFEFEGPFPRWDGVGLPVPGVVILSKGPKLAVWHSVDFRRHPPSRILVGAGSGDWLRRIRRTVKDAGIGVPVEIYAPEKVKASAFYHTTRTRSVESILTDGALRSTNGRIHRDIFEDALRKRNGETRATLSAARLEEYRRAGDFLARAAGDPSRPAMERLRAALGGAGSESLRMEREDVFPPLRREFVVSPSTDERALKSIGESIEEDLKARFLAVAGRFQGSPVGLDAANIGIHDGGDRTKMNAIHLAHAVDNAVDAVKAAAMRADGEYMARIAVRMLRFGRQLVIEVEDNGPGIPEEVVKKLFNGQYSTKSSREGEGGYLGRSGLGHIYYAPPFLRDRGAVLQFETWDAATGTGRLYSRHFSKEGSEAWEESPVQRPGSGTVVRWNIPGVFPGNPPDHSRIVRSNGGTAGVTRRAAVKEEQADLHTRLLRLLEPPMNASLSEDQILTGISELLERWRDDPVVAGYWLSIAAIPPKPIDTPLFLANLNRLVKAGNPYALLLSVVATVDHLGTFSLRARHNPETYGESRIFGEDDPYVGKKIFVDAVALVRLTPMLLDHVLSAPLPPPRRPDGPRGGKYPAPVLFLWAIGAASRRSLYRVREDHPDLGYWDQLVGRLARRAAPDETGAVYRRIEEMDWASWGLTPPWIVRTQTHSVSTAEEVVLHRGESLTGLLPPSKDGSRGDIILRGIGAGSFSDVHTDQEAVRKDYDESLGLILSRFERKKAGGSSGARPVDVPSGAVGRVEASARADAALVLRAARNGGRFSPEDQRALLSPRLERMGLGRFTASPEDAAYRDAFQTALEEGLRAGAAPSPEALVDGVLGAVGAPVAILAVEGAEEAPVLRMLESIVTAEDEEAVRGQIESVKEINEARGERVMGLRVVVRDEGLRARLAALVKEKGLEKEVWVRRVESRADALDEDFTRWREESGLAGTVLRLSFSVSEGISIATDGAARGSPYLAALLEVLRTATPRPMDFQNALSIAADVLMAA